MANAASGFTMALSVGQGRRLATMLAENIRRAMLISEGDATVFLMHPASLGFPAPAVEPVTFLRRRRTPGAAVMP